MLIREKALDLRLRGFTYDGIGYELGFTGARAQQLIKPDHATFVRMRIKAKGKCADCHKPENNGHLHHLQLRDDYNNESNLVYLCVTCHKIRHRKDGSCKDWPKRSRFKIPKFDIDLSQFGIFGHIAD